MKLKMLLGAGAIAATSLFGLAFAAPAGADNPIETIAFNVATENAILRSAYTNGIATTAYLECMYQSGNQPTSQVFEDCNWVLNTNAATTYPVMQYYLAGNLGMLAEFYVPSNYFYQYQPF